MGSAAPATQRQEWTELTEFDDTSEVVVRALTGGEWARLAELPESTVRHRQPWRAHGPGWA